MKKAATVAPLSTGSAMANAIPSIYPGMSAKRKVLSSLVLSASPRNLPPWLLPSTALSFSPLGRRKGSPAWRSAGVYLSTWTKPRKILYRLHSDCPQSLPVWEGVAWNSKASGLDETERNPVNYLKNKTTKKKNNQPTNKKSKNKMDVRKG